MPGKSTKMLTLVGSGDGDIQIAGSSAKSSVEAKKSTAVTIIVESDGQPNAESSVKSRKVGKKTEKSRAKNWSSDEKAALVQAVGHVYKTLFGKFSHRVTESRKEALWAAITDQVLHLNLIWTNVN